MHSEILPSRPQPQLAIVVDTEEEFDWAAPFSRDSVATRSIPAQAAAHGVYDRLGVVPTYVVDYPVAAQPEAREFLRGLREEGRAAIGAHLHPWVTPPHLEDVTVRNSYHCNLPPELERAKIERLTDAIECGFGERPTIFKAGRYGFGRSTLAALAELGYRIDCSFVPWTSFAADEGPSYYDVPDQPFWLDRPGGLLEIPTTSGYFGRAAGLGPSIQRLFDSPVAGRLRLPGMLARSGLVSRARLTPEGVSAADQCRLLDTLVAAGRTHFTLVYHSPTLAPGNTPYVRDEADLARFLATLEEVLTYFRRRLGGRFVTLDEIYQQHSALQAAE